MTKIIYFAALFISQIALADPPGETWGAQAPNRPHHEIGVRPASVAPGLLKGRCTLLAGNGNPVDSPCVNIVLLMRNGTSGDEESKTRTSAHGHFSFAMPNPHAYRIEAASKNFEVASPTEFVADDLRVDLKLRFKPKDGPKIPSENLAPH